MGWGTCLRTLKLWKTEYWGIGIMLVIFFGLRGFVQTDWDLYYWMWKDTDPFTISPYSNPMNFEIGYALTTQFWRTFTSDYFVWVFINTAIDIALFSVFFKRYSPSFAWAWVFFLAFSGLVIEFNLYRNVKAILAFLFSIQYIEQQNLRKFLVLWMLAVCFHTSAIFYLPFYFILNRDFGKILPLFLFVAVNAVFFFQIYPTSFLMNNLPIVSAGIRRAFRYVAMSQTPPSISFGYLERTITFILVYAYYYKLSRKNKYNRIFCNSFYVYYTIWYLFSDVAVFVERLPILFAYSYWIFYPNLLYLLKGSVRRFANILAFLLVMAKTSSTTNHILYRYDNQVTGISTIDERFADKYRYMNNEGRLER